jgi:hypothetical protein
MMRPSRLSGGLRLCCWIMFLACAVRIGGYVLGGEHTQAGLVGPLIFLVLLVAWGRLLRRL